ncbi:hypothetical protein GLOIN_2v1484355 [Rhizophagus irregularis DAOM 181602=DAOM 197198]|uniref:Crinkler effector protein N-terminal domain-containing protein n=1 Tax=Rhizophagus irregularis (strain DAOM 181602 / DAOM 197198 / MUCL 43194) TaxID=747089 RepID=A0A2P4PEL3_RHIID|nr:hypothetical protein GLOIN_2v1484355 [Rhizophagus irregularis DAOM 181602=DAOM 197198]POG63825.1 hypothetical protein GLOIN_2v1484355 [Rhizophagus irregularis DAOM 181602=DAOM 197198]|eukprot:XP_025170691.1 hypothetical protein GLOIN_2v1484355 [Rhizophagus irregularis DAOM 181602=DAOM 197198]
MDLMNAINASIENDDLGNGLWIKKQYDYIDNGDLQECIRRTSYQNIASSGVPMEWQQSRSLSNFLRRDYINNGGENPYENAFAVEIDTMKLVSFFKDVIKENQKPFFDNVASKELKLLKVNISLEEGMIHLRARKCLCVVFNVLTQIRIEGPESVIRDDPKYSDIY